MSTNTYRPRNVNNWNALLYALYIIVHPLDGMWDMKHEKRGSLKVAHFIVFMVVLTGIWKLQLTSFLFNKIQQDRINLAVIILGILLPILFAALSNWGITTLFDGKGKFTDIYMGIAYSLTPYVLIQLPLIFISHVMTVQEGEIFLYLGTLSQVWCFILIVSAAMMVHDYSLSKALVTLVVTLVGMMLIVFVIVLFFSVISEGIAYFVSLFKEIQFRMY